MNNFTRKELDLFCEKHNLSYKGFEIKAFGIVSKCPKCKEEFEIQKELEKKQEFEIQDKKEKEYFQNYLEFASGIPKRYLNAKVDYSFENFKNYKDILENELKTNLFIFGDTGLGKTLFLSQIMGKNVKKYPIYLNGNELCLLQDNDFRISDILKKIDGKKLLIIDELQKIILSKKYNLLDLIIDKAYNDEMIIVLSGNFTLKALEIFKSDDLKRVASRLKSNDLKFLEFKGKDLR